MSTTGLGNVCIRPASMDDSEAIRQIRNSAIREGYAIWTSVETSAKESAVWLSTQVSRTTALVAVEDSGTVLGFAVAGPWHSYEGYARTVEDSIYLVPKAQGRRIGSALLRALMDACVAVGDRTMIAMIEGGNSASISLHHKAGFHHAGRIPNAGEKNGLSLDLVLMSKALVPPA